MCVWAEQWWDWNAAVEDYLGSNGIHLIEEGGKQAPCRELATEQVTGWRPEPEMMVEEQRGEQRGGWEPPGRGREGAGRQGGREAWLLFTAAPPQKGRWRLRRDRSRNKSKSLLCWWSYVESNDLCYFCFSLETKEQTNKIWFHPLSGSILMSLYLCDMVSLSPFASGKGSWCSWHHTACIFRSVVAADNSPQIHQPHRLSTLSGRVYHSVGSPVSILESWKWERKPGRKS